MAQTAPRRAQTFYMCDARRDIGGSVGVYQLMSLVARLIKYYPKWQIMLMLEYENCLSIWMKLKRVDIIFQTTNLFFILVLIIKFTTIFHLTIWLFEFYWVNSLKIYVPSFILNITTFVSFYISTSGITSHAMFKSTLCKKYIIGHFKRTMLFLNQISVLQSI